MFNNELGSPRLLSEEKSSTESVLSPRNFLRFISNSFEDLKKMNLQTPNSRNYEEYVSTFNPYLQNFQQQYNKYRNSKTKKQSKINKNQQMQWELKINRIPQKFFIDTANFQLQLCRRNQAPMNQEVFSQFLDEIQIILFAKAGKYPQKSQITIQNITQLESDANSALEKVVQIRKLIRQKIIYKSNKQRRIKMIRQKQSRLRALINNLQICKKIKNIKQIARSNDEKSIAINEEILNSIKKKQLDFCDKMVSLKRIVNNIEDYRTSIKEKLFVQFSIQIDIIIQKVLSYNKQQWKNLNVPKKIFENVNISIGNQSQNNITILDQTYLAFDANPLNIIHKKNAEEKESPQNQGDNNNVLYLQRIQNLWFIIQKYELYDQQEMNESLMRFLVKHNTNFNEDMTQYIKNLDNQKQVNLFKTTSIQNYASLKNKQMAKDKFQDIKTNIDQQSKEKLSMVEMKLYAKIVKFYFDIIKKLLILIYSKTNLTFFVNFRPKLYEFIISRIKYFLELKKVSSQMSIEDFVLYLSISQYWLNQEHYELYDECQSLRNSKIEEYLTLIQKNLLIKQLKNSIQSSTYLPINISPNIYMSFYYVILRKTIQLGDGNQSLQIIAQNEIEQQIEHQESKLQNQFFRIINKNIHFKNKIYKVCDSFIILIQAIQKYLKLITNIRDFQNNIEEKLCQIIGFYVWYNQKNLINSKGGGRTLKNYCIYFSTLLFLKEIYLELELKNKKNQKTKIQISDCEKEMIKAISMTPFMMIQQKISLLYESKISTRLQVPTSQSLRIIEIIKISLDCFKDYFPLECENKLSECLIFRFMQQTVKLILKNYFGYLINMQKRGISQVKWFLPKFKELMEMTLINCKIVKNNGQYVCGNGQNSFILFQEEIEEMQKLIKRKQV